MRDGAKAESPAEAFNQFISAINRHDVEALSALMSPDHLFVDSEGNRVQGATSMRAGWHSYFTMCPDNWIRVERSISEHDTVFAVGEAGGTIDETSWRKAAAWQAVSRHGMECPPQESNGRFSAK
jgi:ketosteroid isomerase-like protein